MPAQDDSDELVRVVAQRIAQLRERRELTQAEAAERLGIALRNWQRIEAGQNLTLQSLARIAQVLECSVHDLVCNTGPVATSPRRRRPRS